MLSNKPIWILTVICTVMAIIGVLMSDHLRNRGPFTILFAIGFLLNLLSIFLRAAARNMRYRDDLGQLKQDRRSGGRSDR